MTAVRTDHVTLDRVFRRWVRIAQRVTAEQLHPEAWDETSFTTSGPKQLSGSTCAGLLTAPLSTEEQALTLIGQMPSENRRQIVAPPVLPEQLIVDNAEHERVPPSLQ